MNAMKILLILLVMFLGVGVLAGGCIYSGYNKSVSLDEGVKKAWADIDAMLQRRYDLIPNVVQTVKGIAGHEKEVLLGIADARKAYVGAGSVREKAKAASGMESFLSRLMVIREAYPQLRSNESFMKLQDQLEGTENRLTVARGRYNEAVRGLNTYTRKLIGRLCASLAGVEKAEYFEITGDAKAVPNVSFGEDKPS